MILVVGDQAADESVINGLGTVEVGEEKPDEEGEADPVPVGNEVEDEAEEGLSDVEDTEDHPVGEPNLVVITTIVAFDGTNGVHSRVQDSDGCDEDSPSLEDHEDEEGDGAGTSKDESWVDVSLRAEVNENWDHSGVWVQNSRVLLKSFLDFVHCV